MSDLSQRTRTVVAADPHAPAALAALNDLAKAEGPVVARDTLANVRQELLSRGDHDGAETLFTRELALSSEGRDRAAVLGDMGRFYRDFRRDKAKAIDCFLKAFEMDTTRMDLLEETGAIYHAKESFDDLLTRLREEAQNAPDAKAASRWWAEMADVSFKLLDRPDDALNAATEALRKDPTNDRARVIAEQVLLQKAKWPELADFYRRCAREATDPNEKVALLFRLAATWRDKLHDPLRTMETYEEIVSVAPNNIRIYSLIDELKRDRPTWQKVGEGLVKDAKSAKSQDDAALSWALAGKVYLKYLADDVSASECYLSLIKADAETPGALKALRELAARRGDPRILARGLTDAASGAKDKGKKRDLYRELGGLYRGPLQAPSLAAEAFAHALEIDATDAAAAEALEALYAELGEWEQLAEHLKRRIEAAAANRAPALLARLGEVLSERLGQPAAAVESYEDALKREPQHRPSLLALERLYREAKQWQDLARVYRSLGDTAPDRSERIRVHKALAAVSLEHLHDVGAAAIELEAALKLDSSEIETWEHLESAYSAGEKWEDLLRIYGSLPDQEQFHALARSWYRRAAEICARRMSLPAEAALWYRRARLLDPLDSALRDALATQYQAAGSWPELVSLLEEQAENAREEDERATALLRAGQVAEEKMKEPDRARLLYEQAAAASPNDPAPLKSLERIYLRNEAWDKLAEVYSDQARIGKDVETQAAAIRRLARLERDKLKRPAKASDAYQKLAALIPDDREAIDALRTLLAEQRNWQDLLAAHTRALELSTEANAKAQILREMAALLRSELRDPDGALTRLEESLALEPDQQETLDQAAELYALRGRWKEFVDVRVRALPHVSPAKRIKVHLEIARAAEDPKGAKDPALARTHYLQALEKDPRSTNALAGLRRLMTAEGDSRGLASLAERELALDPAPARRAELYKELGVLWETKLEDPARAMASYQAASEIAPDDVAALGGMRRLLAARGAWAEYAKVAELEAAKTKDPAAAASLHRELAKLWGTRFGQAHRAAEHLRKVLEIVPDDRGALTALAEALEEAGEPPELDRVLAKVAAGEPDPKERAKALKRRAALAAGPLSQPDQAVALYKEAIELAPEDAEALGRLAVLLEKRQAWRELLGVLAQRRRLLPPGGERARTLRQLGDLWRLRLQSPENAAEAYREALQEEPDAPTLGHLAEVVEESQIFRDDVAKVAARVAKRAPLKPAHAALETAIGRAWLERFHEPAEAATHFAAATQIDPKLPSARMGLESALEGAERWEELVAALESAAEETFAKPAGGDDAPTAATRLIRAATVARDRLEDHERAIANLQKAAARRPQLLAGQTPEDRLAREALEALYAQGGRWEDLKQLYQKALELAPAAPVERSPLRLRLGDLYRDRFAQPDEALAQYALAAQEDPRNARAHESLAELAIAVGDDKAYAKHAAAAAEALSPHPRAAAWLRRAADASLRAGNAIDAAAFARRALALEPRDAAGLESLAAALRAKAEATGTKDDWDELAKTLARRLALPSAAGGHRGLLAIELARVHAERRGDFDEAARVYERALAERVAVEKVTEVEAEDEPELDDGHRKRDLSPETPTIAPRKGRTPKKDKERPEKAGGRSIGGPAPSIDRAERGSDRQGSPTGDRAIERTAAPAPAEPPSEETRERLEEEYKVAREATVFFEKSERWSGLAAALGRFSEVAPETERGPALRRLAEVLSDKLGDKVSAARALERLTELDPGDLPALELLARLYRDARDWEKLLTVYERASVAAKDPKRAAELLRTLAEVWEKRLGSAEGAAGAYRRLLEILPTDVDGGEGLRRCLGALGRWSNLVEADEEAIRHSGDPTRRAELWGEIARVRRDRLDDAAGAAAAFESMLSDHELPAAQRIASLGELGAVYTDLGRWRDAARVEQERAATSATPTAAAERLCAAATLIADRVGDVGGAIELLESSRGQRVKNVEGRAAGPIPETSILEALLESLLEKAGRHAELEQLLAARPQEGAIRLKRAALLAGPLDRIADALALYREAVEADPKDAAAASSLRDISKRTGSRKDLKRAYERLLDLAKQPAQKAALLCDSADEALRGTAKAAALEEAAKIDPSCRRAIKALRERSERRRRWSEAAEWLGREEPLATDSSDKAEVLGRRASALAKAGQGKSAIEVYRSALSFSPHRIDLLEALAEIAFTEENWEEAAKAYERLARAGAPKDPAASAELARRQGEIALRQKRPDEAIAHFQDALSHVPNAPSILKPLARLYAERGQWRPVVRTLKALLEQADALSENDRVEARLRTGEALARVGDPEGAAEEFRRVLDEKPGHLDATLGLAEALAAAGQGAEALAFLEQFASDTKDVERRRDALRRIGELKAAAGDAEGARSALSEAVKVDASDRRAVEALAKLHAERGEWLEVLSALSDLAAATPAGPARGTVYREIAETYDTGLGDQLRAREFYEKALADAPGDPEAERAMGALLGRLGHWQDLSDHLATRIQSTPAGPAKTDLLIERGRLLRDRLDRPDDAAQVFGEVVQAVPERADARRERAKALSMSGKRAGEAVREYLRLVTDDPADLDAMGGLADAAASVGDEWRAEAATAALAWAGARAADGGNGKRGTFVAASGARVDPALLRKHLVDPAENNPFFDALREIEADAPEVLVAVDAEQTGPMPPLGASGARLAEAGAAIAVVLAAGEAQFVGGESAQPALVPARPPRISLPEATATPAVLFALGAAVDALRDSRHRVVLRDAASVQELFAALAAAALGEGAGGPASQDLVRSIKKTFGWRTKRTLRPILEPLANRIGAFDFVGWRAAVARTGARAGLLVCGDLAIALDAVAGERRPERLRSDAAAADLVRWALSDDYATIRQALIKSVR